MASSDAYNTVDRAKQADRHKRDDNRDGSNRRERNRPYNVTAAATKWGLMAGATLGIVQLIILAGQEKINIGRGLYGFFLYAPFIYLAIREYRKRLAGGEVFKNGVILGFQTSAIASVLMAAMTLVGALIGVTRTTGETVFANVAVYSFFQIIIGLVFGMVFVFIFLQGMKSDVVADENIEKVEGHA